jgi:hypothetical protein
MNRRQWQECQQWQWPEAEAVVESAAVAVKEQLKSSREQPEAEMAESRGPEDDKGHWKYRESGRL